MQYNNYVVWVSFDGGVSCKDFKVVAVNEQAAWADVQEAFGGELVRVGRLYWVAA